jgi:Potential Queuosine, Q, salvage protein family
MPGLLKDVKIACARVAASARWVSINEQRLIERASRLGSSDLNLAVDPGYAYVGEPEETLAWVLTFTAVNFGSGWHPHLRKLPGRSGSITMMSRLRDRFSAAGPLSPAALAEMSPADCAALFVQDLAPPVDELMVLFSRALNDLGRLILDRFDGRFTALVEAADHSAERLTESLLAMPLFDDVHLHQGRCVPILKRAQIAAADLAGALHGNGWGHFTDLDRLTIFADNLIPHVLRIDGILRFDPELLEIIEREELLKPGSEPEVEIRAVAIHAVEEMVADAHRQGRPATAAGIDHLLWVTGQQPRYKARPRHRCRTTYY